METTNLFIYRLRDLRLQGRAGACSHEVVSLPLNPVQFIETCVTVDMQGLGPLVTPGTSSISVYFCYTDDQWKYIKNANIIRESGGSVRFCMGIYCSEYNVGHLKKRRSLDIYETFILV